MDSGTMVTRNRKTGHPQTITGIWMVLLMLFVLELLFYTWCRVQCVNIGYRINEETRRHQHLLKLQSSLKIELARLKSPARIAEIARTRLGMKMPDAKQTIVLP